MTMTKRVSSEKSPLSADSCEPSDRGFNVLLGIEEVRGAPEKASANDELDHAKALRDAF